MERLSNNDGELAAPARRQPGGPPKGDRRREAILEAVEQLLREGSIRELSVESIAARAGISRSGFYFYFESKYAALADALTDIFEGMTEAAQDFFGGTDELPQVYIPKALQGVAEIWGRHDALMVAMFEASGTDPGARALWDAWLERWIAAVCERIKAEREAGRAISGPPDPEVLARTLLLMNERVLYDDRRRRAPAEDTARAVEGLTTVWLATIWGQHSSRVPSAG